LNEKFIAVNEYNGGKYAERYAIENVLSPTRSIHCSKVGANFDLILEAKEGVVLTNMFVGGSYKSNCTCFLKDALVWFSEEKPDWQSYSPGFDNFTIGQFQKLPTDGPNIPDLFISTSSEGHFYQTKWTAGKKCKYIHFKFLRPHGEHSESEDVNIDLEFIGVWGFPIGSVPETIVPQKTETLYSLATGFEVDSQDSSTAILSGFDFNSLVNAYQHAATIVASGRALHPNAKKAHILKQDVNELLEQLSFIDPDISATAHANQVKIFSNLLPIMQLFKLFYGYQSVELLQSRM